MLLVTNALAVVGDDVADELGDFDDLIRTADVTEPDEPDDNDGVNAESAFERWYAAAAAAAWIGV